MDAVTKNINMSTSYKTQGYAPRECHAIQNSICITQLYQMKGVRESGLRDSTTNTFTNSHAYPMIFFLSAAVIC
jgi:hypothetical protein